MNEVHRPPKPHRTGQPVSVPELRLKSRPTLAPLTNYTLASVCPRCDSQVYRHACKVRCDRCGFMWDCSEL